MEGLKADVQKDLYKSAENLANVTHAKVLELADSELGNSLKSMYRDNVEFNDSTVNLWIVRLKAPAMWIEEGRKSGFMEELLNGKSGKKGKNGRYAIIPFKHNKNPSEQSPKAYDLAKEIQYELKKRGVNWQKIEETSDSTAENPRYKQGLIHKFNFNNPRAIAQKDIHKGPLTNGVAVYQTKDKETGKMRKDIMTFRVISEKHKNEGLWIHPGRPGSKLLDKAFDWAMDVWEREILPAVFTKYGGKK